MFELLAEIESLMLDIERLITDSHINAQALQASEPPLPVFVAPGTLLQTATAGNFWE